MMSVYCKNDSAIKEFLIWKFILSERFFSLSEALYFLPQIFYELIPLEIQLSFYILPCNSLLGKQVSIQRNEYKGSVKPVN